MQTSITRQELFIRFALVLVCAGFWRGEVNLLSIPLLVIAWLMDGGLSRLNQALKVPLVQAILLLCALLLIGLSWGEWLDSGRMKWVKYLTLLILVPLYSLLNKERIPWMIGGLAAGYVIVLGLGIYQWLAIGEQGIPLLKMSYLSFSAMLGAGAIVSVGLACVSRSVMLGIVLWIVALALIFVQFHQYGRVLLLATLIAIVFQAYLRYKIDIRKFAVIFITLLTAAGIFAYSSPAFQERLLLVKSDIELLQQGNYSSSLGYRLAMWDVGLHAIAERPLTGYGTGMPERYFDTAIVTYKNGLYKDLPAFQKTAHYHNDWIEIGMHVGVPGMLILLFLYWGWYRAFEKNGLGILGAGLVSYIVLAGLTDAFLIFSRMPVLLLAITALAMVWQQQKPKGT
ncbi:O-antigen ligase family protein [Nitrosomonas sp. Is35]|uniref:O-antigen ligase family protein n=1 Tax=Nitrosomonas sp. Is35 TaxID=3080534 RepID=UPI00294ABFCC|nr:O-antigen ligase family protein [Nitrosomonas sp. Is35]MDV6346317.1 O-antigen ligase family protein [Nitrosomonas sp. Is35]